MPPERETKKTISFTIASENKIKYLGINLTKEEKDLYPENYKPLKTEGEEATNKRKCTPCSCIGSTVKGPYYTKQSIDPVHSLSKHQSHFSQN